ncbi:hypothetical protein AFUB_085880 [Aspergillus fumigatus A1163]|uniref:Uncharacterized protein n=1 Tax=Aspergillus fumigatus (strain CBS 144.89 / FGSC A1163 / CEA10) TaxID=451804 RepID=B0YAU6_ASPFC|nr:hypothetical protein AFUB_085880 [Aspergillus fumigatus A1163]
MREDPGHKERQKVNKISKNGKKRKDRFVKNLEGERTVTITRHTSEQHPWMLHFRCLHAMVTS